MRPNPACSKRCCCLFCCGVKANSKAFSVLAASVVVHGNVMNEVGERRDRQAALLCFPFAILSIAMLVLQGSANVFDGLVKRQGSV